MVVEAWILSIFGWVWFTVQDGWLPSPLSAFVFYGFLVLTTSHLLVASLFAEERGPRVGYFNMVVAVAIFSMGCVADTMLTQSYGAVPAQPPSDNVTRVCCVNCDMPRYHRALFFSGSPFFPVTAGILIGYVLVHLMLAGAQMLGGSPRTVWGGGGWSLALAFLLACRLIVLFDTSSSVMQDKGSGVRTLVIPDQVFYLLIFNQPLVRLSDLYCILMMIFLILMFCEGIPTVGLVGIKIIRTIQFGLVLVFAILSFVELFEGGMLTLPLLLSLAVTVAGSALGMVEAYLGITPRDAERMGLLGNGTTYARRVATHLVPFAPTRADTAQRMQRDHTPVPMQAQMHRGKKSV